MDGTVDDTNLHSELMVAGFFRKVFEHWWMDFGPGRLGREWRSWSLITAGDLTLLVVDGFENDLYVLHPPKTNMKPRK